MHFSFPFAVNIYVELMNNATNICKSSLISANGTRRTLDVSMWFIEGQFRLYRHLTHLRWSSFVKVVTFCTFVNVHCIIVIVFFPSLFNTAKLLKPNITFFFPATLQSASHRKLFSYLRLFTRHGEPFFNTSIFVQDSTYIGFQRLVKNIDVPSFE